MVKEVYVKPALLLEEYAADEVITNSIVGGNDNDANIDEIYP